MTNSATSNTHDEMRCATTWGIVITLGIAACLDIATSTSLSLTDRSPSFSVTMFRIADVYASPVALSTTVVASFFGVVHSRKWFKLFFDLTLVLSLIALLDNLVGLIMCLFDKQDKPGFLLLSASLVYLENIAVFAAFYWRFDHPLQVRIGAGEKIHPGIVFPHNVSDFPSLAGWRPKYVDYLFLSFNTASTFGPTLPVPLRNPIQIGMMLQVSIAMAVLVMLTARAIGLIN
ncbi:MAG: hypothetical protein EXS12_00145 [Phycisphaerales bacterium]|nr:hypothetical protein [Phycisphaerales bacterium]